MTPSDLPEIFLVESLWIDRRIPNFRSLFSISNNCRKFGNDLFNGCRDMGTQIYRPAYLQAWVFKFIFLNLPYCDGLKRLNIA